MRQREVNPPLQPHVAVKLHHVGVQGDEIGIIASEVLEGLGRTIPEQSYCKSLIYQHPAERGIKEVAPHVPLAVVPVLIQSPASHQSYPGLISPWR